MVLERARRAGYTPARAIHLRALLRSDRPGSLSDTSDVSCPRRATRAGPGPLGALTPAPERRVVPLLSGAASSATSLTQGELIDIRLRDILMRTLRFSTTRGVL